VLSGDNEAAVKNVALSAGADEWHAALLPEQKLQLIGDMSRQQLTAMVGDGINDAPALASATLGIAMGRGGSDIAIEAADVVLMNDDLRRLPFAFDLSLRTRSVITQNIALALAMKFIFVVGLFAGWWGEWQLIGGVVADMGTTLLVTANGLRLLRA
jgi:Cd2+/Zn2+-exporting ATPase